MGKLVQSGAIMENTDVCLDKSEFDRHIFVAGVTGGGKTYTCKWLLTQSKWPFLVIEPAKTEYRELVNDDKEVLVFTLGDEKVAPFRLNPLEFTKDESIPSRVDMLMASISAAFDMEAAIPQIIEQSIYRSYEEYGWNIKNNRNSIFGDTAFDDGVYAFPTLEDVVKNSESVVREKNFGQELGDRYLGSVRARLEGLLVGAKGMMLNCKRSMDFKELLGKKVVLELEEIRNGSEKALVIGFILTNLLVAIKQKYKESGKINHFTLVEEAHRLMTKIEPGDSPNKKNAVETFADMLAEVRKYGESMIIADQIPNKLMPEVLKNTNIKIVHRLFAKDDKDVIGSTMALDDDQKAFLSSLKIGHAIVFSGNWAKAMHVKVTKFEQSSDKRANDEVARELRCNVLRYYLENRSRGIFPGLDILDDNPGIDFMEKYIDTIQNEDLRAWFDLLCEIPIIYDKNGRKKTEMVSRPFDLDEDSPVFERLRRMVDACGL
ncbi:MAG: ATP-binding protein, partial [Victivallales bacterium]|nr:ATP-binding protein [Victivallales bacterium]